MDKREDAGEFYPGGKVISTRPVATGGDVKHSDFAGLDVKTNTIPDLRDAVRELGRRLGATVVTALAACVAVAATVQTVPVNDLDFDANPSIVTNVVFDAPPDFSTNNVALVETIEAKAPDLSPFLRKDLGQVGWQEFGGFLSGMGFHVTHEVSNFNGWNNYTAKNGPTQPYQSLPQYIQSNPWGFALTNDFVRKTGDTMTGALIIAYDENLLSIYPDGIYFSGATGVNYIYYPDNIYGSGEIGYGDLHYRGGFDIFATREWADNRARATVTNTVPAWARATTKPAYTAAEVGAVTEAQLVGPTASIIVQRAYRADSAGTADRAIGAGALEVDSSNVRSAQTIFNQIDGKLATTNGVATGLVTYIGTYNGFDYGMRFAAYGSAHAVQIVARSVGQTGWSATSTAMLQAGKTGYIAFLSDIDAAISPTSPAFSNAVLSVGLGIDTNTVAVINELVDSAHDLPVSGATSVGALLLALAAAVAALKGNKADKPTNPTNGNLVKVSGTGELQDAGYHFEVRNGIPCIVQYT